MTRYLSGLCVAGLGLCGGGWLVVAAVAFGGESAGRAGRVNLLTGAVLIAVCFLSLACWSYAWRQRMRADGVLADRFPVVSRREARRNRRALSRDVRRAAKLAGRSARGARRAARRSARLAGGGELSEEGVLGQGGVLGEGVALGIASAGDGPSGAAAPRGAGVNGSGNDGAGVNGSVFNNVFNGTAVQETGVNGKGANGSGINGAGANPGERAAELISELRSMLEPLLAATGAQPGLAEQAGPAEQAGLAEQPAAAAPPLPQRTRFASEARPRVSVKSVPTLIPRRGRPRCRYPG